MDDSELKYDRMVEEALRGVVLKALAHAAEHGLPGNHHFYITFRTDHPGVEIAEPLRQRYPGEMTIILQHQYWDLAVGPDRFSVTLAFSGVRETLAIPVEAVIAFADPSMRFGLQFESGRGAPAAGAAEPAAGPGAAPVEAEIAAAAPAEDAESKVVPLDAFRKK